MPIGSSNGVSPWAARMAAARYTPAETTTNASLSLRSMLMFARTDSRSALDALIHQQERYLLWI